MFEAFRIVAVLLVAIAWATSLAHALEMPGKKRLDEATYRAVQKIYYPGFTMAGFAEILSIPALVIILFLTPAGSAAFWLVLVALIGMIAMVAVYWLLIHPVNKFWTQGMAMSGLVSGFFGLGSGPEGAAPDWTWLRDRWEHSHLARAVLTSASFLPLIVSLRA